LAHRMAMGILESVGGMFASTATSGTQMSGTATAGYPNASQVGPTQANGMFKSSPQSIQIINNSGEKLEVTQARSKSTGQDQVVSIVIDSIMRNKNGSRDMLRGALA
jgi:hypothetical protein